MPTPVASIVIATYQHAAYIGEAVCSALRQTVPVEVVVVDDGSTDTTTTVLEDVQLSIDREAFEVAAGSSLEVHHRPHLGVSAARNYGLEQATAPFVMFLDADDVIAPTKVAAQLAAVDDAIGWVLCDVQIEDAVKGRTTTASVQYRYDDKHLGGWIRDRLEAGNFIPLMAPLVRRSVLEGIQFDDRRVPEDWHFWCAVAAAARVRYVPKVLATYRHRRTGRSRLPKKARAYSPNPTHPLRLNLGCGTPTTRSWHPIAGMVNLDKALGWTFEDGLGEFADGTIAGITVSHALMYVAEAAWPAVFAEFARVLAPGGVLRITEDDAVNPASSRHGGWRGSEPAVTLTSAAMVRRYLERAGLVAHDVTTDETRFTDGTLRQAQHGEPPHVFFIEGVRVNGVLFSPHNDDEALFAAFTVLRYRPHVVVCFGSDGDYGPSDVREAETREAMAVLGAAGVEQWQGGDVEAQMRAYDARVRPTAVWAPDLETSHPDHRAVAKAALAVFGDRLTTYHTYVDGRRVTSGRAVPFEPAWVSQKLRALLRYGSQIAHPRAHVFFMQDQREWYRAEEGKQ